MKVLLDTNILIRLIIQDDAKLIQKTLSLIKEKKGYITTIVLAETMFVLIKYYNYKRTDFSIFLELLDAEEFEVEESDLNIAAIKRYCSTSMEYVDAWLYEKSLQEKMKIVTLDKRFNKKLK